MSPTPPGQGMKEKIALWRGMQGLEEYLQKGGRSLSQSSGKSAGGSVAGLHWTGVGGLCKSHMER